MLSRRSGAVKLPAVNKARSHEPGLVRSVVVRAPAKVNLYLRVLRRRSDGYHDLESLFFPISLYDTLSISVAPAPRTAVSCRVSGPERVAGGPDNLAARAALALLERLGETRRIGIALRKVIPVGAGLGGGSSDAATVLRVLPGLLRRRLPLAELERIGAALGADVPFFVRCRPSLVTGIGDRLDPLRRCPQGWMVVAVPRQRVSTAWAFEHALPGLTSAPGVSKVRALPRRVEAVQSWFFNDFGVGVEHAVPAVRRIRERLERLGARATVLSGSGSAVVGWYDSAAAAENAACAFSRPDQAFVVRILRRAPRISR